MLVVHEPLSNWGNLNVSSFLRGEKGGEGCGIFVVCILVFLKNPKTIKPMHFKRFLSPGGGGAGL